MIDLKLMVYSFPVCWKRRGYVDAHLIPIRDLLGKCHDWNMLAMFFSVLVLSLLQGHVLNEKRSRGISNKCVNGSIVLSEHLCTSITCGHIFVIRR